jgi:hypothetical protein
MLVTSYLKENFHVRIRNNCEESVRTRQRWYVLECDCCGEHFEKSSKHFKNTSMHVCSNCDHHKLAQKASVKQRRINKYVDQFDASSGRYISSFRINDSSSS